MNLFGKLKAQDGGWSVSRVGCFTSLDKALDGLLLGFWFRLKFSLNCGV
jgi:hypothetical protein